MKTFPDEKVPLTLYSSITSTQSCRNSGHIKYGISQVMESRVRERFPEEEGGDLITTSRVKVSWPFKDRNFVAFIPHTTKEDWYRQKAFMMPHKNAWHLSKPAGADGFLR